MNFATFIDCHKINMETNFKSPQIWIIWLKMCFTPKKLFLGETDYTATYLSVMSQSIPTGYIPPGKFF